MTSLTPAEVIGAYPGHAGTLASMLTSRASTVPDRDFIVFGDEALTYSQVLGLVERAASMYRARGVEAGQRVGVMSNNHPSIVLTWFALAQLGAVMVPVNPDFRVEETRYVFNHAEVSGVLCSAQAAATVREAIDAMHPQPWLLFNDSADGSHGTSDACTFDAAMQSAPSDAAPQSGCADASCVFIYTSGTTGFPKGVMHSQRNVLLAGEGFVQRMYLQPTDRLMCVLPMFHINALFYSLAGALAAGATLVLMPRFSASRFWHDVARHRVTEANTLAAVTGILMRRPRDEYVAGHSLRKIYGAPFSAETHRVFRDEFNVPTLVEGYGMSEIPGALNNPFPGPHKVGSMGLPSRHPDAQVTLAQLRVVDDAGNDLPNGQTGELIVKTPMVMQGYFRDPEQTAAAFRDGWFLTGDLAWRDDDGYFWFVARKKDIIRRRGENISGAELDRIVESHPDVQQAAAIGVPNDFGDDDILIAVVPRPGATLAAPDVAAWVRDRLAAHKVPRYVAIVEALPLTPTHRVAKFKLRGDIALRQRAVDIEAKASPTR